MRAAVEILVATITLAILIKNLGYITLIVMGLVVIAILSD